MDRVNKIKLRKIARDFKTRIYFMKRTPLEIIESIFLEKYQLGLIDYLRVEQERFPEKSRKDIIIDMYKLHDRIRGRKK